MGYAKMFCTQPIFDPPFVCTLTLPNPSEYDIDLLDYVNTCQGSRARCELDYLFFYNAKK
jgi:hypothetical protein